MIKEVHLKDISIDETGIRNTLWLSGLGGKYLNE